MINIALNFLTKKLNTYVIGKLGLETTGTDKVVVLTNASNGNEVSIPESTIGLSLVNIEEERVFKEQRTKFLDKDGRYTFKEPELKLNLYILISANHNDNGADTSGISQYNEGLKRLSHVIGFFQANNVFTSSDSPELEVPGMAKLVVDLYSYSFEQMYNFWSVLGISYLPSVLYKVRLLTYQVDENKESKAPLTGIGLETNHR